MAFFKTEQEKLMLLNAKLKKQKEAKEQKEKEHKKRMKLISDLKNDNIKLYDAIKKKSFSDIKGYIDEFKNKHFAGSVYLIMMELRNGFFAQFLVKVDSPSFKYKGGEYIIDDRLKYYNESAKIWSLDYHQDFSMPVGRKIDVTKLKQATQLKGVTDVDQAINPYNLREFVKSEVVQKILKGADLDKFFVFIRNILLLILVGVAIILVMIIKDAGFF